nr:LysR substrate-binding domain-containing protein [Nocardia tengchongensis]
MNASSASCAPTTPWAGTAAPPSRNCAATRTCRPHDAGAPTAPLDEALAAAGLHRHVAAVVPTSALAALLVSATPNVGLVPQRLAEQYADTLGLRWFPIPAPLPEVDIRLLWHARLDADPAQRWLRDTLRTTLGTAET